MNGRQAPGFGQGGVARPMFPATPAATPFTRGSFVFSLLICRLGDFPRVRLGLGLRVMMVMMVTAARTLPEVNHPKQQGPGYQGDRAKDEKEVASRAEPVSDGRGEVIEIHIK